MNQIGQLAAYMLWVGCSFAFVALVPADQAPEFMSSYASGSLVAGLFSIPIYTSWRSRTFDLLFVGTCAAAIGLTYFGYVLQSYWIAAIALNIVDFSVAQVGRPRAIIFSRIAISLCALLLLLDFALALQVRLALCAGVIAWTTFHKAYEGHQFIKLSFKKILLTALTCALHYGPLIAIPYVAGQHAKYTYLLYAITGSVILKMQDFIIKSKVTQIDLHDAGTRNFYYGICGLATIGLLVGMVVINPWLGLFALPVLALVATIRIVDNVSWA